VIGAGALALAGCATQIGPAFRVEKQRVEVRYDDGFVRIRGEYRLRNNGSQPLHGIQVSLSAVNPGAATDLTASVDGAALPWKLVEGSGPRRIEIALPAPWPQKKNRTLVLEYGFRSTLSSTKLQSFQLLPGSWSPELLPPAGLFGRGGGTPEKWDLHVTVPEGVKVHATGRTRGTRKKGGAVEHRFRQEGQYGLTYVVAGRYEETQVSAEGYRIHFWSAQPPRTPVAEMGRRLGLTLKAYAEWFGPLGGNLRDVWVMDGAAVRYVLGAQGASRPGLARDTIVAPGLFMQYPGSDEAETYCAADAQLAALWLDWLAHPAPEAAAISDALARHAADALPHGCARQRAGGLTRQETVARLLKSYAAAEANYQRATGPRRESFLRERDGYRMRLLVYALEERAGRDKLHAALRRMLQALRGSDWGPDELRSAIEGETAQDFAEFFREWLGQPGIPEVKRAGPTRSVRP
jgi:hypothetical protein